MRDRCKGGDLAIEAASSCGHRQVNKLKHPQPPSKRQQAAPKVHFGQEEATQAPPLDELDPPEEPEGNGAQTPAAHVWPAGMQFTHACPLFPQVMSAAPPRQLPVVSQQPPHVAGPHGPVLSRSGESTVTSGSPPAELSPLTAASPLVTSMRPVSGGSEVPASTLPGAIGSAGTPLQEPRTMGMR